MKAQRGATLAVVLLLVLAIALIGAYSVRNSISALQFSTHRQIQSLLFQSSDAALFQIEDPSMLTRQLAQDGIFHYFDSALNMQDELVLCYRASQLQFFLLAQASAISPNGDRSKRGERGFCKVNDYATARAAVYTQMYVTKNQDRAAALSHLIQGSGLGQSALPLATQQIHVMVISVLPSFSAIASAQLEQCFQQKASQVVQCFVQFDVPFNVLHASYAVESQAKLKP